MEYTIALDIGGTKIEGVLFDRKYKQIAKIREYHPKKQNDLEVTLPRKDVLAMICSIIDRLKVEYVISGIGVSIPDVITPLGRVSGHSKIQALSNFNLSGFLKRRYNVKVIVRNDADCFALGEQRFGAGKGYKNVVGVIYGTGIGSGIVLDGKLYLASRNSAGDFGHNVVNPTGPYGRTGVRGIVEAYCGGPNLVNNYIDAGGRMKEPSPGKIFSSEEDIAKKVSDDAIRFLAIGLSHLMNILSPDVIVIGGGQSYRPIYRELNRITKEYTFSTIKDNVKIVRHKLGDSAGVYGAAVLIFDD